MKMTEITYRSKFLIKTGLILFASCLIFASCSINPSIMLKTKKDFPFDTLLDTFQVKYKLAPNDILEFSLTTNDGYRLLGMSSAIGEGQVNQSRQGANLTYLVEQDGRVNFPVLGRVKMAGLSLIEAEEKLEELYSKYYNRPFATITISNRRVIIFPGTGGAARILNLENENTTLIEAIAMSGGITHTGKAKQIKLIRGEINNPKIYKIDLSTIEGAKMGNIILQANDIIYVEPLKRISQGVLNEISPVISLITSILFFVSLFAIYNN